MNNILTKIKTLSAIAILFSPISSNAFVLGIGVHPTGFKKNTEHYIQMAQNYGFNSFRADMQWQRIESKKSIYTISNILKNNDFLFKNYSQTSSTSTLLILNYGNKLYTPQGYPDDSKGTEAFANYTDWVSNRYREKVRFYEIWNEWLQGTGVPNKITPSDDPRVYTQLVKESYEKIKKNDANAIVMIGSINPTIPKYVKWANGLIESGILRYSDAISIHAYSTRISKKNTKEPEQSIAEIDNFERTIVTKTGNSKPIYITEMGYPTMLRDNNLSEYNVAEKILKFTLMARSRPYIKGLWWYDLIDHSNNRNNPEDNYGFFYFNEKPKLSALYLKKISYLIIDDSVEFSQKTVNNTITVNISKNNGKSLKLSWIEGKPIDKSVLNNFFDNLEKF